MSVEIVGTRYQTLAGNLNQIFFALGTGVVSVDTFLVDLENFQNQFPCKKLNIGSLCISTRKAKLF